MKGRFALTMMIGLLFFGLAAAPIWAVDPPGRRGAFVDPDEPFMTDRVLEEDLDGMPDMGHDFDRDFDKGFDHDFDEDAAEEVRRQIRKDIPELTDELNPEEED